MPTKPKKPKSNRQPIVPIRFTEDDLRQLDKILKANPHLQNRTDAVRFAIHQSLRP